MEQVPLLLIAFNRPAHTKLTIDALRIQAPPMVYVYQDGPRDGNSADKDMCEQVRKVVQEGINWPCELHVHLSKQNKGCRDAVIYAISEVLKLHEAVIVVEDDIITSPAFYAYMCKALDYYRERKSVFSISGYNLPADKLSIPEDYDYDVYASPRLLNWGWATWRDRWEQADWTMAYYEDLMRHSEEISAFKRGGDDLLPMLIDEHEGHSSAWDIQFAFTHFANHAVSIVPCESYTYNTGLDGSGTHCVNRKVGKDNNHLCLNSNPKFINNLYFDKRIINAFYSAYSRQKRPFVQKVINYVYRKLGKPAPFVIKRKIYAD